MALTNQQTNSSELNCSELPLQPLLSPFIPVPSYLQHLLMPAANPQRGDTLNGSLIRILVTLGQASQHGKTRDVIQDGISGSRTKHVIIVNSLLILCSFFSKVFYKQFFFSFCWKQKANTGRTYHQRTLNNIVLTRTEISCSEKSTQGNCFVSLN